MADAEKQRIKRWSAQWNVCCQLMRWSGTATPPEPATGLPAPVLFALEMCAQFVRVVRVVDEVARHLQRSIQTRVQTWDGVGPEIDVDMDASERMT